MSHTLLAESPVTWNPAVTLNNKKTSGVHPDWLQVQSIFEESLNFEPQPRNDWEYLAANYFIHRD